MNICKSKRSMDVSSKTQFNKSSNNLRGAYGGGLCMYPIYPYHGYMKQTKLVPIAFPPQHQDIHPGYEYVMVPRPISESPYYKGSGKLKGQVATITGSEGTTVDILLTKQVEFAMDKQLSILAIPKQSPPLTYNIDLKRLKEVITVTGTLLDEDDSISKTKLDNLRTIMQNAGKCTLAWGAGSEFSYDGNIVKLQSKQLAGRIDDASATRGSRTDIFEIMLQFSIGTHRG